MKETTVPKPAVPIVTLPSGDLSRETGQRSTKQQREEARIERLTLASFELFAERGYHNTTIELLCRTANVSTRDFYKLNKTKETLMAMVYLRVAQFGERCVLQALANSSIENPQYRLDSAIEAWVHANTHDTRYATIAYLESIGISDELEQLRKEAHHRFAVLIQSELERRSPGASTAVEGKLPVALIGAANELMMDWLRTTPRPPAAILTEEIKQLYVIIIKGMNT